MAHHDRQRDTDTNPGAFLFIRGKDKTVNISNFMSSPGLMAIWTVDRDCVSEFLSDPFLKAYIGNGVRVRAYFECKADAKKAARYLVTPR